MRYSVLLLSTLGFFAAAQNSTNTTANIFGTAQATSNLTSLVAIIGGAGYESIPTLLAGSGPFTFFAPSDAALTAAGLQTSDSATVVKILNYHVVKGNLASTSLPALSIPESSLVDPDLGSNKSQVLLVKKDSTGVKVDYGLGSSNVIQADLKASNGVIHIIDKVLAIPKTVSATAAASNLTSLTTALTKANLTDTLDTLKGITIFAPSNAAFSAQNSTNSTTDALAKSLNYHVYNSVLYSNMIENGKSVKAVSGETLYFFVASDGTITINNAKVTTPNVLTTNGVVHVIDKVLVPGDYSKAGSSGSAATFCATPALTFAAVIVALLAI